MHTQVHACSQVGPAPYGKGDLERVVEGALGPPADRPARPAAAARPRLGLSHGEGIAGARVRTARDQLREEVARGVHHLSEQYPREVREAGENLGRAIEDRALVAAAARQLIEGSGYGLADPSPVRTGLLACLRRFHGECWA